MTQIRLGKRAVLVKSCRGQDRDFNGGMLMSWELQMFLGRCRCPMGDAYVLEGCGCPREGCRYTRDWMLVSWGEDADVPGRGCSCPWGDADVPGRPGERVHMPRGAVRLQAGRGQPRERAVPHSLCTVPYPPLAASQPGSQGLPSGIRAPQPCTPHSCTPQPCTPRQGAGAAHPLALPTLVKNAPPLQ